MKTERMEFSFYVIDDLRLDDTLRTESRFLFIQDALARYQALPGGAAKELGITDGEQTLRLIRRAALLPGKNVWKNVLVSEQIIQPPWRDSQEILNTARECVSALDIRHCLTRNRIVPKPLPLPEEKGPFCYGPFSICRVYLAGLGWLSIGQLERRFQEEGGGFAYPLILKYLVNVQTDSGPQSMKLTHWELRRLESRAVNLDHMSLSGTMK